MEKLKQSIRELFEEKERILIILHKSPDGDTISSSLALASYLKKQGKTVELAVSEKIPEIFEFLLGDFEIKHDFLFGDFDLIVAVDCGDVFRTGFPARIEKIAKTRTLVNIDHHPSNSLSKFATVNLVDDKASAAAEIVFDLLKYLDAEIDSKMATCLLAGIYYDTGGFQHPNVTERTLSIASECIRLGARIGLISSRISANKSAASLKLWGIALGKLNIKSNGIVSSYLTLEDLKKAGAKAEDASGVVNLINTLPEAKVAILFLESADGTIKASVRTERDDVDVSKLARLFGGGGHKKAAGFTVEK